MAAVGTQENPLRVAIIGSGPSGFYTVSNLLKQSDLVVEMDMFDRLPTPYGLVRAGVAPTIKKTRALRVLTKKALRILVSAFLAMWNMARTST